MTEDDKRDWMHLQGRIMVLELMMRSLLTAKMLENPIRQKRWQRTKPQFMARLSLLDER